jgi:hypothetical protein
MYFVGYCYKIKVKIQTVFKFSYVKCVSLIDLDQNKMNANSQTFVDFHINFILLSLRFILTLSLLKLVCPIDII